jgi:hypothetical protein
MDWWLNCINLHQGMFVHFNLFSVPGYFCLCGYILQDYVKSSQNRTLTKKLWNQLKHNGIVNNFIQAHQSLKRSLQVGNYPQTLSVFETLLRKSLETFIFPIDHPSCTILANHGFITPIDLVQKKFQMGPPIIVQCLGYLLFKRKAPIIESIPFRSGQLDIVAVMNILLPNFDPTKMKRALQDSYKTTEVKKYRNDTGGYHVPKETNYLVEMVSLLQTWLPITSYTITTETNCKKKYADIHLKYTESEIVDQVQVDRTQGYILELISNERFHHARSGVESDDSVIGHITRANFYGQELGSTAWVIHFVTVISFPIGPTDVEWYTSDTVNYMYIYHDDDFEKIKMFVKYGGQDTTPLEWKMTK